MSTLLLLGWRLVECTAQDLSTILVRDRNEFNATPSSVISCAVIGRHRRDNDVVIRGKRTTHQKY